ncbi:PREDICTED: guanine nucleotide-binding protein-like 1 [Dufourea novaeangliae]|uniref:Guanine nucleotide-binding protein-like 1 n=1 Tax=Dufourea novaeangliae TaxID=178035 RepID=A0A154P4L1_DUFNO|nr:PREDICTED: guanine nucleotide-binding protein-like 1 [Dufourea novaeangliae]KZC06821.1 Guanine nucleotide-binding protein-like 1 [Dufourea novaeangliae]
MPQGTRKKPFSGKAKKQQLQAKKQRQNPTLLTGCCSRSDEAKSNIGDEFGHNAIQKINKQPIDGNTSRNKYALQFFQENKEELMKRKEESRSLIKHLSLKEQEISDNYFPPDIDMPKRPPWDFNMLKEQLELREQKYFTEYLKDMEKLSTISYFELNLETWRQLWRVLEMSDILLIIVDIRYPVLMFPPYLYHHVTNELKKDMILVLNKVDLVPPALVVAWKEYFQNTYPKLHILMFTSYPTYNLHGNINETEGLRKRRRRGKLKMAAEGAQKLLDTCKEIVRDKVNLSSWHEKIQEEMQTEYDLDDVDHKDTITFEKEDTSYFEHERYKNGMLTIGCIGTPNVGKSSLMNALMGKKVVSVSRTPGHTKHFQTIYLTRTVCLCDCPGLVFPSTVPKQLQILMGSFPIAQVREPYTTVKFLAERVDLPKLLKIQHPDNDDTWSAMDICDGWAIKRNFITARAARLDTYRAANSLLRMALEGKICIHVYPPGWVDKKETWENHPDVELVRWIQASNKGEDFSDEGRVLLSSEDDETEEEPADSGKQRKGHGFNDSDDTSSEESEIPKVVNKFEALSTDL